MEEFSWNALVSNVVSKLAPANSEAQSAPATSQEEGRGEFNEKTSTESDTREGVDTNARDLPLCAGSSEKNCTPFTAEEVKADIETTQVTMAETLKERNRMLLERVKEQNPHQAKCGNVTVSCNPDAYANKEESRKPVLERNDDALEFVFDLVEIALCGDKKTNIDEAVPNKPTQKEQMPDPVKLLREKSIFQTLNPGSSKTRSKQQGSAKAHKTEEPKKDDSKKVMPTIEEDKSKETGSVDSSKQKSDSDSTEPKKQENTERVVNIAKPASVKSDSASTEPKKQEKRERVVKPMKPASENQSQAKVAKKQDLTEMKKHDIVDKKSTTAVAFDEKQEGNLPPRVIHLELLNDEAEETKSLNASKYSHSFRKMTKVGKKMSSAVSAFNRKGTKTSFGDSTRVLGDSAGNRTMSSSLVKKDSRPEIRKVAEFLSSILSMGKNMNSPKTPKGIVLLASVVSFLFWPEDLPRKAAPAPAPAPAPVEVPSLLSLVGDKKSTNRKPSPLKRRLPRPQLSTRRMHSYQKMSFDL
eukprot:scaffold909_cov135-Cylindrotheca_fusiformis.AAC.5